MKEQDHHREQQQAKLNKRKRKSKPKKVKEKKAKKEKASNVKIKLTKEQRTEKWKREQQVKKALRKGHGTIDIEDLIDIYGTDRDDESSVMGELSYSDQFNSDIDCDSDYDVTGILDDEFDEVSNSSEANLESVFDYEAAENGIGSTVENTSPDDLAASVFEDESDGNEQFDGFGDADVDNDDYGQNNNIFDDSDIDDESDINDFGINDESNIYSYDGYDRDDDYDGDYFVSDSDDD